MRGANFMELLGYIYLLEIEIMRSKKEKMQFLPKFAVPKISGSKLKLFYGCTFKNKVNYE